MNEDLNVYVDRLKEGKTEKIECAASPDFLEVEEPNLRFDSTVDIRGDAYVAEEELILHLDISTAATIPCSICNEPVSVPVVLNGLYHAEPLGHVRTGVYNMAKLVRENVLLETPSLAECQRGACPERKTLGKYLKKGDNPFHELK